MTFQWPDNSPVQMVCVKKWQETPNAVSFTLQLKDSESTLFDFNPGQFISLGVEIDGKMEYRAYSLSSVPNQDFLQLTVKRVEGGKVSNYIVDQLKEGEQVSVLAPQGEFHIQQPHSEKLALISAGCGITPVMSMAKTLLSDENDQTDIHFIHAASCLEQIIYHQELVELAAQHENFHLHIMLKDPTGSSYMTGRWTELSLKQVCPDIAERSAFVCGPEKFMSEMKANLETLGVDMNYFYQESFTPAVSEQPKVDLAEALTSASVFVPTFGAQAKVAMGSALIDALEQAKVPVIAACRSGVCGSCKCKVTSGEFTRTSTMTLTDEEIANGYVLACSCQVESDLEIALN
ncbi:MAG: FAD-binding oxidoreductase [Vibrio sp.]